MCLWILFADRCAFIRMSQKFLVSYYKMESIYHANNTPEDDMVVLDIFWLPLRLPTPFYRPEN